ncbi:hypothetical protein [Nocardioides acrostichi]|uniref:Uncharacterized protein n=1 Tax=Nocardioides acrostichi TaxID=2784339 RepID=A0A930UXM2_9ACTN|nr:hypothetical protein [Nocardioides acrostichi]MBF4160945.1 hypothetical protein [Nocardioides acrostichi]
MAEPSRDVALADLESSLVTWRCTGGGALAALLGVAGSTLVAAAIDSAGDIGLVLALGLPGLLLAAGGAALGRWALLAGRRVVGAYVDRCAQVASSDPRAVSDHLLSSRGLLRGALLALAVIGLLFAVTMLYVGFAPGDPADLADGRTLTGLMGVGWSLSLLPVVLAQGSGQLRTARAVGGRLARETPRHDGVSG